MKNAAGRILAAFFISLATLAQAVAQDYPTRPVRMIVSYAAGNVSDVLGRLVAQRLADKWGQPVVVENRPGIGGSLGADIVSKAAPDGYTLLFTAVAAMAVNPQISTNVHYDPIKDFAPVGLIAFSPLVLVSHPSVPVKTLKELIDYSKKQPTPLSWGTPGLGTISHLTLSYLKLHAGLAADHVPYRASNVLMTDLLAGRVHLADEGWPVVQSHVNANALRAIALGSLKRSSLYPELETASEMFPGLESGAWSGVMAPAGTPAAIVNKVNADIQEMIVSKDMSDRLLGFGMEPLPGTPAFFAEKIKKDAQFYGGIAREIGLKME